MSVTSSAGGQNMRVGRRESLRRGDLFHAIEAGWRYFWGQRGIAPPPVSKTQIEIFRGAAGEEMRLVRGGRVQ